MTLNGNEILFRGFDVVVCVSLLMDLAFSWGPLNVIGINDKEGNI